MVYPEFSKEAIEFVRALSTANERDGMTSPEGLEAILRLGLAGESNLTNELLAAVQAPCQDDDARVALAGAAIQLRPKRFEEIARALPDLDIPMRMLYRVRDRLLPDISDAVARLERDLSNVMLTPFSTVGTSCRRRKRRRSASCWLSSSWSDR